MYWGDGGGVYGGMLVAANAAALISSHLERYLVPSQCKEHVSNTHTNQTSSRLYILFTYTCAMVCTRLFVTYMMYDMAFLYFL